MNFTRNNSAGINETFLATRHETGSLDQPIKKIREKLQVCRWLVVGEPNAQATPHTNNSRLHCWQDQRRPKKANIQAVFTIQNLPGILKKVV